MGLFLGVLGFLGVPGFLGVRGGVPPRIQAESQSNPGRLRVGPPSSGSSRVRVGCNRMQPRIHGGVLFCFSKLHQANISGGSSAYPPPGEATPRDPTPIPRGGDYQTPPEPYKNFKRPLPDPYRTSTAPPRPYQNPTSGQARGRPPGAEIGASDHGPSPRPGAGTIINRRPDAIPWTKDRGFLVEEGGRKVC